MAKYIHDKVIEFALADPEIQSEYDSLEDEFKLFEEMIKARIASGKTQEDIAKILNTTKSAISRLENAGGRKNHSPNLATLYKYAKAIGYKLHIKLIPIK